MGIRIAVVLLVMLALNGCTIGATNFAHPDYNFGFVETVGVIPFENLTEDRGAAARMSRYFVSELLAAELFNVVEPGEVSDAMVAVGTLRVGEMKPELIVQLGQRFGAQALFLASVTESGSVRTGTTSESVVTLDVRLVETETGVVIWGTTITETGRGFWASLFGTNGATMGEVSRTVARKAIRKLSS